MKTLQEIKDEVAKEYFGDDFPESLITYEWLNTQRQLKLVDAIATAYAKQALELANNQIIGFDKKDNEVIPNIINELK